MIGCNMVENLVAGRWCLFHYYKEQERLLLQEKEYFRCAICKKPATIFDGNAYHCNKHFRTIDQTKVKCEFDGCNKTKRLTEHNGQKLCHNHLNLLSKGSFIRQNIPHKKEQEMCSVINCNKRTKLIYHNDKKWCPKHFNLNYKPRDINGKLGSIEFVELDNHKNVNDKINGNGDVIQNEIIKVGKITYAEVTKSKIGITDKCKIFVKSIKKLNSKEKEVCHANDCKMYKQLYEKHQGKWCKSHLKEISLLRKIIKKHNGSYEEVIARLKEIKLCKYVDENHIHFANILLQSYQESK